jgi:NAD(P)H-hydrate epimerase
LLNLEGVSRYLPPHPPEAHKYTFGHVAVLAGSEAMPGASVLCSESAMTAGAGLVTLLAPKAVFSQIQLLPEIMRHSSHDTSHWTKAGMESVLSTWIDSKKLHALALGPGLGRDADSIKAVKHFISHFMSLAKAQTQFPPVVLDADALFALAELDISLSERFIMTPHVGEAARLLGVDSSELSADLLSAAQRLRERYHCHVVLKSATTVIALLPEGDEAPLCWISPWGNSGMATAGSGDVLTGILAAQLGQAFAQNLPLSHSILLGVALHGLSGDFAAEAKTVYACHASDICLYLPDAYKLLKSIDKT